MNLIRFMQTLQGTIGVKNFLTLVTCLLIFVALSTPFGLSVIKLAVVLAATKALLTMPILAEWFEAIMLELRQALEHLKKQQEQPHEDVTTDSPDLH